MRKVRLVGFLSIVIVIVFFSSVPFLFGFTAKSGENLTIKEDIVDDLYIAGNNVVVSGKVDGDCIAAGGEVSFSGNISQDLVAAGGNIDISGNVGDDIRTAGGTIKVSGRSGGDLVIAGGQIKIYDGAVIEGDLVAMGSNIYIAGEVKGKVIASGGQIDILGKVGNGVEIKNAGKLSIFESADITGDINYSSLEKAVISENAKISGNINFTQIEKPKKEFKFGQLEGFKGLGLFGMPFGFLGLILGISVVARVIMFISLFALGIIILAIIPKVFDKFNNRMKGGFGYCVAGGAIILFGVPIAVVAILTISLIILFTAIGASVSLMLILISALILILYFILVYISILFLSYLLGKTILSKSKLNFEKYGWKVLALFIGLAIIMLICAIPIVGGFARFAAILFGLGGIVMIIKDWLWQFKEIKK